MRIQRTYITSIRYGANSLSLKKALTNNPIYVKTKFIQFLYCKYIGYVQLNFLWLISYYDNFLFIGDSKGSRGEIENV